MKPLPVPSPGVYPDVEPDQYHAWDCASHTRLTKLRRTPAHLRAYLEEEQKETPALMLGRAIHCAVLEPDDFASRYTLGEQCAAIVASGERKGKRCSNDGLLVHKRIGWVCGVHGKDEGAVSAPAGTVITVDQQRTCLGVRDSVFRHPAARGLVTGSGQAELSITWKDTFSGTDVKARLDRYSPDLPGGAVVDLKTCEDASEAAFMRSIFKFGYYRQGPLYLDGARARHLPIRHFVFLAAEKKPPYAVAVYRLLEGVLKAGRDHYQPLLQRYAELQQIPRAEWPAYGQGVRDIGLPDFAWKLIDEEIDDMERAA